jgi:hypothetical protein
MEYAFSAVDRGPEGSRWIHRARAWPALLLVHFDCTQNKNFLSFLSVIYIE